MYLGVHKHVSEKIKNHMIESSPYQHMVVDDFFPQDFYQQILKNKIPDNVLTSLKDYDRVKGGYSDQRNILKLKSNMPFLDDPIREFWENLSKYINYHFRSLILQKFKLLNSSSLFSDLLYVKDTHEYQLGPHTDKTTKVITCLIYLPSDELLSKYGTSIYLPKDPEFKCPGGPHHKRDNFDIYKTIEFIPNRMFCFLKNDHSFHGVEPVTENITRNLLIFDIQKISKC